MVSFYLRSLGGGGGNGCGGSTLITLSPSCVGFGGGCFGGGGCGGCVGLSGDTCEPSFLHHLLVRFLLEFLADS